MDGLGTGNGNSRSLQDEPKIKRSAVSCEFVFQDGGEFYKALPLSFFFVDVLDGDDAACDVAVEIDDPAQR